MYMNLTTLSTGAPSGNIEGTFEERLVVSSGHYTLDRNYEHIAHTVPVAFSDH